MNNDITILKKEIKPRQTVIDFTCQYSGTMDALFYVLLLNSIGITQAIAPGTILKAPQEDLKVIKFFDGSVYGITTDERIQPVMGGIGYMQIGSSFKVS